MKRDWCIKECIWRILKLDLDRVLFLKVRNNVFYLIEKVRIVYYKDFVLENSDN